MLITLFRTLILYILIIFTMRVLGKRQIGELQPAELVITILLSEIIVIPMQDTEIPLVNTLIPVFVLAGFEDMNYKAGSMTLDVGDLIFQYTDGVTEATNVENQLYGMERLEQVLNRVKDRTPSEILPEVKKDIDAFVGEAPQFDDITMLCVEYKAKMEKA